MYQERRVVGLFRLSVAMVGVALQLNPTLYFYLLFLIELFAWCSIHCQGGTDWGCSDSPTEVQNPRDMFLSNLHTVSLT